MNIAGKILTALTLLLITYSYGQAAETVHIYLRSNGERIDGQTTSTNKQVFQQRIAEHIRHKNRDKATGSASGKRQHEPIVIKKSVDKASPQVKSPTKGTAMASGRRTYEPIVIRKRIDKSSPLLEKAAKQRTRPRSVIIKQRGKDGRLYKIELEKAIITSYQVGGSGNDETIKIKYSGLRVLN